MPYYSISPTYSVCKNHGYLAGEQFSCPECGEKTEVYSRITGYYRPVQNWNDGKAQEYKERKVYSKLNGKQPLYVKAEEVQSVECEAPTCEAEKLILFTTKTCPKCRMAKMFLDGAGIQYETLLAEENAALATRFGIKEAPTLVVLKGDVAQLISNPSNIKGYVDAHCVKA